MCIYVSSAVFHSFSFPHVHVFGAPALVPGTFWALGNGIENKDHGPRSPRARVSQERHINKQTFGHEGQRAKREHKGDLVWHEEG